MSNWKITGPPRFSEGVGMVYPVTKGGSRFNAAEEDELKALLAGRVSVNDRLPEYGESCRIVAHYEEKEVVVWASDVTLWMPLPDPPTN